MSKITKLKGLHNSKVWDYENGFYWFSENTRISKIISYSELYKSITKIPGHVIELGVYKANSLIRFATFRNLFENDYSRKIIGFDTFSTFPIKNLKTKEDINFAKSFEKKTGIGLSLTEVNNLMVSKGFKNFSLIDGNVLDTLPVYLKKNKHTKIALLHLDMDVEKPSQLALELLHKRIVSGGLIIFDNYNEIFGETSAVDKFLKKHKLKLEKLPFNNTPSFIRI